MKKTNFEIMLLWLLADVTRFTINERGEIDLGTIEELKEVLECDHKLEHLKSYFNALMYGDKDGKMLGFEAVDKMFPDLLHRYPGLTRVLTIYVYS